MKENTIKLEIILKQVIEANWIDSLWLHGALPPPGLIIEHIFMAIHICQYQSFAVSPFKNSIYIYILYICIYIYECIYVCVYACTNSGFFSKLWHYIYKQKMYFILWMFNLIIKLRQYFTLKKKKLIFQMRFISGLQVWN